MKKFVLLMLSLAVFICGYSATTVTDSIPLTAAANMSFSAPPVSSRTSKLLKESPQSFATIQKRFLAGAIYKSPRDKARGFHLGGFALGFLLNFIGVIIAVQIRHGYRSNRIKWALIGWGTALLLIGILILVNSGL